MTSKRSVGIALVVAVALVGGACGGGGKPEASVQSEGASKEKQRGLPEPTSGYYLAVPAVLSGPELDALTVQFYGTATPGADPPENPAYDQALDDAAFEKATNLRDEAKGAGFDAAKVVARPGGKSGCTEVLDGNGGGVTSCGEGVGPGGYLVVLAGPFDGPPPTEDDDLKFSEHSQRQVDFMQAKTAEVWTPLAKAKAPRLALLPTAVSYWEFPTT